MPCFGPLKGYYSAEIGKSGRRRIVFDVKLSLTGIPVDIPCGQCVGCRLERSRQWAMRCMQEKRMHLSQGSSFVTLTYDDEHLPMEGNAVTLRKRDLQLFMKRLRFCRKQKGIRFYACGEYGDRSGRPHYHVLLFNVAFGDQKRWSGARGDAALYTSRELQSVWTAGNSLIGEVTFESCAYVARYCMKKVTGDDAEHFYGATEPEFTVMSRRPGLGAGFFKRYGADIYATDSVVVRGKRVRPPRFYDSLVVGPMLLEPIKRKRKVEAVKVKKIDNCSRRRYVKERVLRAQLSLKTKEF